MPPNATVPALPAPQAASAATIQFLIDWQHVQRGAIERGGRLTIEYDTKRLARCFTNWRGAEFGDIIAHVRFHPSGAIVSGSVVAPIYASESSTGMVIGHRPVPLEVLLAADATQIEMWFHGFSQTTSRCDAWDSRFGQNYWFDIGEAPV